eukprot:scaffold16816_cov51-Phaeocystis_antarctica.AAC.2
MQPCTAHSGRNASVTRLATLASSEHGDGPHRSQRRRQRLQQSTRSPAPCTTSEHGDGPSEPTTKAAAAAKHLHSPAPRTAVETPAYRSWRRSCRARTATAHQSRRRRQRLQQSTCTVLHRAQR